MGLSGRKAKQRIGDDPRNLSWADDAAKFGQSYLSKFGWDSSKGLGASGEGRLSHIKVSQKLDMLGIGAAHRSDPNGTAWKQNQDFENLLKRLNGNEDNTSELNQLFTKQSQDDSESPNLENTKKRKKDHDPGKEQRKRSKREAKAAAAAAASQESSSSGSGPSPSQSELPTPVPDTPPTPEEPVRQYVPRHRAHRAKAMASKRMSSKSSASIAEILGVSPLTTPSVDQAPSLEGGTLTMIDEHPAMEKLTTSSKSVSDYFKERLSAKSSQLSSTAATPVLRDVDDAPRVGLGSSSSFSALPSSPGLSQPSFPTTKFASLLGSTPESTLNESTPTKVPDPSKDDAEAKAAKKKRKEEKKAAKKAARTKSES